MDKIFEIASKVSTPLALAGIVIVALFLVYREVVKKKLNLTKSHSFEVLRLIIRGIFVLGLVALSFGLVGYGVNMVGTFLSKSSVYRVRITVIDSHNQPVRETEVISAPAGEQKPTSDGWEIVIPDSVLANDRKLRVWAKKDGGIYNGSNETVLGNDYNPGVTIILHHETSARIRGQVSDEDGNSLSGVTVYVENFFEEGTTTDKRGLFDLPAHAAPNEHIHLFVERIGYQPWNDVIPAGGESLAMIVLTRK